MIIVIYVGKKCTGRDGRVDGIRTCIDSYCIATFITFLCNRVGEKGIVELSITM